ncbi:MAG: AMP-binding protein [Acidimicrobiales bacterium]|nr:AMP-binding protein [Acidimicrobiales bacterium]
MVDVDPVTGLIDRPPPRPYPYGPRSLAALLDEPLASTPDKLALIDGDRTWTYAELDVAIERTAAAMAAAGIQRGSRVAWTLPNCAELPVGFLATQRLGALWLGVNAPLAAPEKEFLLDDAEVTHYIGTPDALMAAKGPAVLIDGDDWRARVAAAEPGRPAVSIDPHAPAAIAYTSGTTGRPKGAVHSQHNLVWPGLVTLLTHPVSDHERQGTALAHTILNMLILGSISGLTRGSTAVILHSTRAEEWAADVARYGITRTTIVPTMAHDLLERDIDPSLLASLEFVIAGGAAVPADARRRFVERFGVRAITGYGLSEAPSGIVRESPDEEISDTVTGYAMAPFQLSIRDENGSVVGPDEEGEICLGPRSEGDWAACWTPMLGYWKRPEATATALADGVLHTGDIGRLDADARLTISGRRSDLILRGGANVYPVEVENVLLTHPSIDEAVVLGIADDRLGERVAAAVVLRRDAALEADALRAHCAEQLAGYKVPDRIVAVTSLPRNAMGKVVKAELEAMLD